MNDLMLDLETLGTKPGAVIASIGAVFFDVEDRALGQEFYRIIDIKDATSMGLAIEADAVRFWISQSDAARAIFKQPGESLAHTLAYFSSWILSQTKKADLKLWGCGSDFDNVLLAVAYQKCDLPMPWSYVNNRDYRTIREQHRDIQIDRSGGVHHNAIDDAKAQALHMIAMLNPLPVTSLPQGLPHTTASSV